LLSVISHTVDYSQTSIASNICVGVLTISYTESGVVGWPVTGRRRCDLKIPVVAFWRHKHERTMLASTCLNSLYAW